MCEAHAFLLKDGKEEIVLENVDQVEVTLHETRLVNIFGEQKTVRARIKYYHNTGRKILLEPID